VNALSNIATLRIVAVVAVGVFGAVLGYVAASPEGDVVRLFARYVQHLDQRLRGLFLPEVGRVIALVQLLVVGGVLAAKLIHSLPMWSAIVVVTLVGPELWLRRARSERVARLEKQVDGFVVTLANSLKTVPSPAAALHATTPVLQEPMRQEIEQVLKEIRVGSTLEEGIVAMSARVNSRWLDVALSAVLVGLKIGGNLPTVLERTAATIREMNRLLGVVRTKTGEGRMQLWVLALFPLGVGFAFNFAQPGYFDIMRDSLVGQMALGVSAVFWIASLLVARKILQVDV